MISVKAKCIGLNVKEILDEEETGVIGKPVNIFKNTIYIKTSGNNLIVVTRKNVRAPININIMGREDFRLCVKPFKDTRLMDNSLEIGNLEIDLRDAAIYHQSPLGDTGLHLKSALFKMRRQVGLALKTVSILMYDEDPAWLTAYKEIRKAAEEMFNLKEKFNPVEVKEILGKLVGLGPGFTPTGDDFIRGFLIIYNALSRKTGGDVVAFNEDFLLTRTNWASSKLIIHEQNLSTDEFTWGAVSSLLQGNPEGFFQWILNLPPIGYTSGLDKSMGVFTAIKLISSRLNVKIRDLDILNNLPG